MIPPSLNVKAAVGTGIFAGRSKLILKSSVAFQLFNVPEIPLERSVMASFNVSVFIKVPEKDVPAVKCIGIDGMNFPMNASGCVPRSEEFSGKISEIKSVVFSSAPEI